MKKKCLFLSYYSQFDEYNLRGDFSYFKVSWTFELKSKHFLFAALPSVYKIRKMIVSANHEHVIQKQISHCIVNLFSLSRIVSSCSRSKNISISREKCLPDLMRYFWRENSTWDACEISRNQNLLSVSFPPVMWFRVRYYLLIDRKKAKWESIAHHVKTKNSIILYLLFGSSNYYACVEDHWSVECPAFRFLHQLALPFIPLPFYRSFS